MRIGIEYTIKKSYGNVLVTATITKLIKEPQTNRNGRLDFDSVKWIVFPEWIERGLFLKNVKDFEELYKNQMSFKDYYEVEKDFDLELWVFKETTPKSGEKEKTLLMEIKSVRLVEGFNSKVKKGGFELHQLVKKKELENPVKKIKRKTKYSDIDLSECDEF